MPSPSIGLTILPRDEDGVAIMVPAASISSYNTELVVRGYHIQQNTLTINIKDHKLYWYAGDR